MTLIAVKWTYLKRNTNGLLDASQIWHIKSNTLSRENSNSLSPAQDSRSKCCILPCNDQSDQALVLVKDIPNTGLNTLLFLLEKCENLLQCKRISHFTNIK